MQNYIRKYKQCKQTSLDKLIQLGLLNDLDAETNKGTAALKTNEITLLGLTYCMKYCVGISVGFRVCRDRSLCYIAHTGEYSGCNRQFFEIVLPTSNTKLN